MVRTLPGDSGISMTAAMMQPGDEKVVAQRVVEVLSARHTLKPVEAPATPASNLSGGWDVEIKYAASGTTHRLQLQQNGNRLDGIHQGNFLTRDITGTISGDAVTLSSSVTERHGDALSYRFRGKVSGDTHVRGSGSGRVPDGDLDCAATGGRRQDGTTA